ncbi:MAG: Na+/H+ antiporter NhaA [Bdellovibrionaceae bacterium]|nr:Na+/H+ antiporter NhaA [Pseudobdellovibrionaceae bacterium]
MINKWQNNIRNFLKLELVTGLLILCAAIVALILSNSAWSESYFHFIHLPIHLSIGSLKLHYGLQHWVNDALMVLFFYVVGLEIKKELIEGELASPKKAALPIFSALGGMLIPACIYLFFNYKLDSQIGWGIPMATDIAFSLGALNLVKQKVPLSLKVFLLSLAIVDDLGAILVIALFYTQHISIHFLSWALSLLLLLYVLRKVGLFNLPLLIITGLLVWVCFIKSGVHSTIAGVLLAFLTPLYHPKTKKVIASNYIEKLHSFVNFVVLPLFAFSNAGIVLGGQNIFTSLSHPVSLGVSFGLLLGKPLGILSFALLSIKLKLSSLPKDVNWTQITGIGLIAGMGFTMSIFVTNLSFVNNPHLTEIAKLSVLLASLSAAILGIILLNKTQKT